MQAAYRRGRWETSSYFKSAAEYYLTNWVLVALDSIVSFAQMMLSIDGALSIIDVMIYAPPTADCRSMNFDVVWWCVRGVDAATCAFHV